MEDVAVNSKRSFIEMNQPSSRMAASSSTTKTERKVVEKNRRNHMKALYANLNSLLPKQRPKESLPLPDQIDEAINYIKNLEEKLKKSREKKESLVSINCSNSHESTSASRTPNLQIKETGSSLQIIFISGLDNQFIFYEIIRILHEEGVDISAATYSLSGSSIIHVVHAEMGESDFNFGVARVTERLNRFVYGWTGEIELEPELWDFNYLQPETWAF